MKGKTKKQADLNDSLNYTTAHEEEILDVCKSIWQQLSEREGKTKSKDTTEVAKKVSLLLSSVHNMNVVTEAMFCPRDQFSLENFFLKWLSLSRQNLLKKPLNLQQYKPIKSWHSQQQRGTVQAGA